MSRKLDQHRTDVWGGRSTPPEDSYQSEIDYHHLMMTASRRRSDRERHSREWARLDTANVDRRRRDARSS